MLAKKARQQQQQAAPGQQAQRQSGKGVAARQELKPGAQKTQPAQRQRPQAKKGVQQQQQQQQQQQHGVEENGEGEEDEEDLDFGDGLDLDDDESGEEEDGDDEEDEDGSDDEEDEEDDDEEEDEEAEGGHEDTSDSEDEELAHMIRQEDKQLRKQTTQQQQKKKDKTDARKQSGSPEAPDVASSTTPAQTGENDADDDSDTDSSDDEHVKNTLGRIPLEWYDEYPHLGYDLEGRPIPKPADGASSKDQLDRFLDKMERPDEWWNTLHDKLTDSEVVLTDKELDMIERITGGHFPDAEFDPFEKYVDFFTGEKMIHPVSNRPEPKSRFVPSKWEAKKIVKLARAIRMGWIKTKEDVTEKPRYYLVWNKADEGASHQPGHIPAPKVALPQHIESYNPPGEYLFTKGQEKEWRESDVTERRINFMPHKYPSLRLVPAYNRFLQERFERCLDLYLCPRVRKNRINIDPESLVPKLPNPRDLQPFPTTQCILYEGHTDKVRTLSADPTGQWLATGSDDRTVRIWEVGTARCVRVVRLPDVVQKVAWSPNKGVSLVAVACAREVYVLNPQVASEEVVQETDLLVSAGFGHGGGAKDAPVHWERPSGEDQRQGVRLVIRHHHEVRFVTWHRKGDYFSSVCPEGMTKSVYIHQLSKHATQNPFKKNAGLIQCVQFHPSKPIFFVATQRTVRVYNLMQQELVKKLQSSSKWISSMEVHPKGDNVIIGSYDKRLSWFDMDLSTKPYKVLRYHSFAIRRVAFHRSFPLFASASDDGTIQVFHGMVYNDLLQNPLIVPLKILHGHRQVDDYGALDCEFHPIQPWIFSCGADNTVRLYN